MRKPEIEDSIFKLLGSSNEADVYIAVEWLKSYTFEDLLATERLKPSSDNEKGYFTMYYLNRSERSIKPLRCRHRFNDVDMDIWQSIIFFIKR